MLTDNIHAIINAKRGMRCIGQEANLLNHLKSVPFCIDGDAQRITKITEDLWCYGAYSLTQWYTLHVVQ